MMPYYNYGYTSSDSICLFNSGMSLYILLGSFIFGCSNWCIQYLPWLILQEIHEHTVHDTAVHNLQSLIIFSTFLGCTVISCFTITF